MTFVSFILPAYKGKFLQQAIDSILKQSYQNFELIIVDDCSPDNLKSIIASYNDDRISYYKNKENIGRKDLVAQWNHCISYAKGDYIILASDDDLYYPNFLEACVNLAEKYPQADLIRSRVEQINESGELIGIDGMLPEYCSKYQFLFAWLQATTFTCIGNYMFKANTLKRKKFIDFPCAFGSDTASVVYMAENGVANTTDMLFMFRISSIHLSSNKECLKEKLEANTLLFIWLSNLNYSKPEDKYDKYFYEQTQKINLYYKCKYDYYNLVIKFLPLRKIKWIHKCELLSKKDKWIMLLRAIMGKIL